MNLPAFCIRRPAFTIVISLVMMILGVIGYINLSVRWIPNINPPLVNISTTYPGASAKLVERDVTKVIEDSLSGINNVDMLTSSSHQGRSEINIKFKLGLNMNAALEDVRSGLERVRGSLPREVENPIVSKADPNSQPILYLSFSDSKRDEVALGDYIDRFVKPEIETVDGVGTVWIYGRRVSAMHVWLDPEKMTMANVTTDEIANTLREHNASVPAGQIKTKDRNYSVVTDTQLKNAEQINNLIIKYNDQQATRIKDIGKAVYDAEDTDSAFRVNGKVGIALGIVPQTTANPLDVETAIQAKYKELIRTLPQGMHASILFNQANYIRASIKSVYESFFEAVLCVIFVILAFLASFRATLIPIITIPVCMISTFALIYFLGFTINTITLMALVLAIGLVVDDAIVMLENIKRHIESGMSVMQAALKGSREIIFPIIAMTITLAAVYTPIAFTPGLLGVLFREFTFTLAGAVILSGIVALTLSPMMCSRLLTKDDHHNRYYRWQSLQFNKLQQLYQTFLTKIIHYRKWVLLLLFGMAVVSGGLYWMVKTELAPYEDQSSLYVSISGPRDASFAYTDHYVKKMEAFYQTIPDIDSYFSLSGMSSPSRAIQLLTIKPKNKRQHTVEETMAQIEAQASQMHGVWVNPFLPPPPLAEVTDNDDGDRLSVILLTSGDYLNLQLVSKKIIETLKENPMFTHVYNSLRWDSDQFQISIDLEKAADLRLPIGLVTNTLSTLIAGKNIGKFDEVNFIMQMNKGALANPNIFNQIYVRNALGHMISLANVLTVSEASGSEMYKHFSRLRADTINLGLTPQMNMSDAMDVVQSILKQQLPDNIKFTYTGAAKNMIESNGKSLVTFGLALIFIYLVLVAQFESFIDPFIILLTVPFAVIGAMLTLVLFHGSLNIYSNIGLITLIGLITKHGILIVDFANKEYLAGATHIEAIIKSAKLRLRPILMTTAAMVLGALPLALATGPGAESRQQIGLVVSGGMLFGTFFSLVVVPVAYTYLAPYKKNSAMMTETLEHAERS